MILLNTLVDMVMYIEEFTFMINKRMNVLDQTIHSSV